MLCPEEGVRTMEQIILVQDLKKTYHGRAAVQGISFAVEKGSCTALLGPNGAGKSTTLNILCTCTAPDSGLVLIDGLSAGHRNYEIRRRIGIVFQNGVLDERLTVEENLDTRGRLYGFRGQDLRQRILQTAAITGISDLQSRPYGQLSGGQKRRCDIARALLHGPKILFLDEPATGLDPEMRSALWNTIEHIQASTQMTIFLTTHYMDEAARASHIIMMKNGKIAVSGTPALLKKRFSRDLLLLYTDSPASLKSRLAFAGISYRQFDGRLQIPLAETGDALPVLTLCRGLYTGFEVHSGNLDDAYLSVMEGEITDA